MGKNLNVADHRRVGGRKVSPDGWRSCRKFGKVGIPESRLSLRKLFCQTNPPEHILKSRVVAQRIEDRIYLKRNQHIGMLRVGSLQVGEHLVLATHTEVRPHHARCIHRFPPSYGTGVWGDTSAQYGSAVYATADNAYALLGFNNGASTTALFENSGSGYVLSAGGGGGSCAVAGGGNLLCTGSKSAVVPVDGGNRMVALYAVEAPENWFEDFGSGRLENGQTIVHLEPTFVQTVNTGLDYHVFLTSTGDSRGLYIAGKTSTSFEVPEQGGGTSSIGFDYRIVARRKGYENVRLADKTKDFDASRFQRSARLGTPQPSALPKHAPTRPVTQASETPTVIGK